LLLQKSGNLLYGTNKTHLIWINCLLAFLLSTGCLFAAQPAVIEAPKSESAVSDIVETACELIYQGKFNAAGELIKQSGPKHQPQLSQLSQIVQQYRDIIQRRVEAREAAYREQSARLEKFRLAVDTNDVNDVIDVNDVNDISKVLSVITKVREFADEQQRDELLSDSYVKLIFQKAIDKAAEFESKGKYLDAYTNCYLWLQMIAPDNKDYSDCAEKLVEKANIAASLQDSPCETCRQRYEGVEKKMFTRAIDALNFSYVSIIDYRQMALKAISRCELLAEVWKLKTENPEFKAKELTPWLAALAALRDEVNQSALGVSKDEFINVFEKVLALNKATIELPEGMLIAQFAEAALSSLDPYTVMVWPKQVQDFEKTLSNKFTGIGVEISKVKGLLTVVSLLPDTPAYNSGLDAGDVIERVDGVATNDMSIACAVKNITGPEGTTVALTIRRPGGDQTRDITITRARIIVPTIRGWQRTQTAKWLYMIDGANKIGYVRITGFSAETASDLEKVLCQLEAEGLRGLILDLRRNPGGLLPSAIEVTDKFITEGMIVSTRGHWYGRYTYAVAHKEKTHPNYPIVVLMNRFSASASEIVAGALADKAHNRAILVGERTHGKGVVQGVTPYPGQGAQLKYTMAHYYLPSGQRVESREAMKKQGRKDWGIGPNIEVKLGSGDFFSDEERKIGDIRRDNEILTKADHDSDAVPLKRHTAEETIASDPQLAIGLLAVRTKLIQAQSLELAKSQE